MITTAPLFKSIGQSLLELTPKDLKHVDKKDIIELLRAYGVLLFRIPDVTQTDFEDFTKRFTSDFVRHGAMVRRSHSKDGATQSVTKGSAPIVLHRELHFSPFSPDIMWFYCKVAPTQGGATTVADGIEFFNRLSKTTQNFLINNPIKYKNVWSKDIYQTYFPNQSKEAIASELNKMNCQGTFDKEDNLTLEYLTYGVEKSKEGHYIFGNSIAIHEQYFSDVHLFQESDETMRHGISLSNGEKIPRDIIYEINEVGEEVTYEVPWQNNDFVMLDNTRMLHGRRTYPDGVEREILVRMANLPELFECAIKHPAA